MSFEMPIIEDVKRRTAIDIVLSVDERRDWFDNIC